MMLTFWWLGPGDLIYNAEGSHQTIAKAPKRGGRELVRTALISQERLESLIREGKAARK